ncbi:AbrB family transcriptional regulator [Blastococcus sp. CT_GayMR16]|uniref:AbrB family transcriptional regulator n=1 Tax=Blastococcus sp. CT_GayMR16 TaxID=2559607 RepID=UPI0010749A3D|nr:AbrB family transcriptional regulator [Blastococcus sp. CT_GayMR16]TFV90519.1 AbrB family transcriptional regulator [Blastococcus sp. CT_GayMR16]
MGGPRGARLLDAATTVAGAVAASLLFGALGLPSPALFGGLLAGLVRALWFRRRIAVPPPALMSAQAVVGVALGALVDLDTLRAVAENWLPVLLVTVGTLALSLVGGQALRLHDGISPVTGAFAMIAGGASGIIVMARELGADERMVAVLQYLRVLLIVVLMPVVATTVYGASPGSGSAADGAGSSWPVGLLFAVACGAIGLVLGRLVRLPVAALLGPMLVAAGLDLGGLADGIAVPALVQSAAFLVIGLQVGVSFTRQSVRTIGRALPLALTVIVVLIVASAGLGAVLAATTGASALDGYLATTPGGLYAVLATATDSGADATFVLAVQVLRLFVMLLSAPLVARVLRRSGSG